MNALKSVLLNNNLSVGYVDAHSHIKKSYCVILFLKILMYFYLKGHHVSADTSQLIELTVTFSAIDSTIL